MNWLMNLKPKMVIWREPSADIEGDVVIVQPVCANRVFKVRHKVAVKRAGNDKNVLKLLRGSDER